MADDHPHHAHGPDLETMDPASRVRERRALPRVRKDIYNLSDEEVNNLRKAYAGLYRISQQAQEDERGYQWIAGVHGFPPPVYCQHGNLNFTTWHRPYVYEFELRLQMIEPSVMLPYWPWESERAREEGIPKIVADRTYVDPETGDEKENPLWSAFSQVTGRQTQRDPGTPPQLGRLATQVEQALALEQFSRFSPALENPHGGLHVWVGGDMGSVPTSSYDPIFWLHHCNVDRQWWQWQQQHGNSTVPEAQLRFVCAPFPFVGSDTLETEYFGYVYAESETYVLAEDVEQPDAQAADTLPATANFSLHNIPRTFDKAYLEFHGLQKTKKSYVVRVYCSANGATYDAGTGEEDPAFANSLFLFGHGEECPGADGHCDPTFDSPRLHFDRRPPHHLAPYDTFIDITLGLRRAVDAGDDRLTLSFVVLDEKGEQVPYTVVEYDGMAIVTR